MMGLTPGLLVRAIFLFALKNPLVVLETSLVVLMSLLVVFVARDLEFLFRQASSKLVTFLR